MPEQQHENKNALKILHLANWFSSLTYRKFIVMQ